MKIYLQKFKEFNTVLELDIETRNYSIISKQSNFTISGFFSNFDSDIVGVFCQKQNIYLYFNEMIYKYDTNVRIEYFIDNNVSHLNLCALDSELKINYLINNPVSTLMYSEIDEDSDFGLWLSNLTNSEERRQIFLKYNSSSI